MFFKRFNTVAAAALLAVAAFSGRAEAGVAAPPAPFGDVTVTEAVVDLGFSLEYTITNGLPADQTGSNDIVGFAVGFLRPVGSSSVFDTATSVRSGWGGGTTNSGGWNTGISFDGTLNTNNLSFPDTTPASYDTLFASDGILDTEVVFFAIQNIAIGLPINPGVTQPGFKLSFGFGNLQDASNFAAICTGGIVCAVGTATSPVPEPGALALFGVGVIGLGFAVRRRRRTA